MPKGTKQKLKLIYLSRIFEERTDRYHGLTLSEISSALGEYGISAERKSLYDDIEALSKIEGLWGAIVGKACYTGDIDVKKAVEMAEAAK